MNVIEIPIEVKQLITTDQAWHFKVLPKEINSKGITFYISHSSTDELIEELELLFGNIILIRVEESIITHGLARYYRDQSHEIDDSALSLGNQDIDDFLGRIINEAHKSRSSDIHIEPLKEKCRIRFRIDGRLLEKYKIELSRYPALLNKIKVKANLDIAEKRLPQDGRIEFTTNKARFDIRVSTLPSIFGEKVVLRLLSNDLSDIEITHLGFSETQLEEYLLATKKNQGIILISGPTGSGKTTTLYATLKYLNSSETNILTIEDPVEYTIDGINQVPLKESIGLTFAKALRTFLRQDPDIIMIGEIRDIETAQISMRAALTGHLVLSTVHTNSAWGTICRLVDMGVASYIIADTLILSVAQRLVRKLCPKCKVPDDDLEEKLSLTRYADKSNQINAFKAIGCQNCNYTGYKGRIALYEVLPVTNELKQIIKTERKEISEYMSDHKIKSIQDLALSSVKKGETSIDEIMPLILISE